jgi:hypothetical protein
MVKNDVKGDFAVEAMRPTGRQKDKNKSKSKQAHSAGT